MFNQSVDAKRRLEFLGYTVIHDRKFPIWRHLKYRKYEASVLPGEGSNKRIMIFDFQSNRALYHSPKTESCPHQNYQDEQIHGNYNHPESLLQIQRNHYSLSESKKNEVMKEVSKIDKLEALTLLENAVSVLDTQHARDSCGHVRDTPCGESVKILIFFMVGHAGVTGDTHQGP